ncbi:MAG: class I SAM-dependent methyltransferase [Planctomycetota bacterium]
MRAPNNPDGQTREKATDLETVLPPVSKLIENSHSILNYVDLDGRDQKLDYRELAAQDPYPIPMPVDREGYGSVETSNQFWATGYGDWLNVKEAMRRFDVSSENGKLFDFGCASGRFLRHVATFSELESQGCDFAPANVAWVQKYLPDNISVTLNTSRPDLPFGDGEFDVVTAFSVFTHIDQGEEDWLAELTRITKPNGILYLTIQNEAAWEKVNHRPGALEHLSRANLIEGNLKVSNETFDGPMPQDKIVFRMSDQDVYSCNVWHTNEYVLRNWSKHIEVLQIASCGHTGYQSPVIAKPKK